MPSRRFRTRRALRLWAAVAAAGLAAGLAAPACAGAHGRHWSQAQCDAAFAGWATAHPHATPHQHEAEFRHLSHRHGCRFGH